MADRKQILTELIEKYQSFKEQGRLDLSSEETMRTWINEFLANCLNSFSIKNFSMFRFNLILF